MVMDYIVIAHVALAYMAMNYMVLEYIAMVDIAQPVWHARTHARTEAYTHLRRHGGTVRRSRMHDRTCACERAPEGHAQGHGNGHGIDACVVVLRLGGARSCPTGVSASVH